MFLYCTWLCKIQYLMDLFEFLMFNISLLYFVTSLIVMLYCHTPHLWLRSLKFFITMKIRGKTLLDHFWQPLLRAWGFCLYGAENFNLCWKLCGNWKGIRSIRVKVFGCNPKYKWFYHFLDGCSLFLNAF